MFESMVTAFRVSDALAAQAFKGLAKLSSVAWAEEALGTWPARADPKDGSGVWRSDPVVAESADFGARIAPFSANATYHS